MRIAAAVALVGCLLSSGAAPADRAPRAVQALQAWLDVFNRGEPVALEAYDREHVPWLAIDEAVALREASGGRDLLGVDAAGDLWVTARVRDRNSGTILAGSLVLRSSDPAIISFLSFDPAPTKGRAVPMSLSERRHVLDATANRVRQGYVLPEVGKSVADRLDSAAVLAAYSAIPDRAIYAARLTDDLRMYSGDRHMQVVYSEEPVPADVPMQAPPVDPQQLAEDHCGIDEVTLRADGIGYLKIGRFEDPDACAAAVASAFDALAGMRALIIDVRDSRGGAPTMVALLCGYLIAAPTHLDDLYTRLGERREAHWSASSVAGRRFTEGPVVVLQSRRTFSAAELLAFDLKRLHRATLVGEFTGGGAHTVEPHRVGEHFFIALPSARMVDPVSGTDWEGTGVEPDVPVPATEALAAALKRLVSGSM